LDIRVRGCGGGEVVEMYDGGKGDTSAEQFGMIITLKGIVTTSSSRQMGREDRRGAKWAS